MRPVSFDWKKEHGGTSDFGFIGEELGKTISSAVQWEAGGEFAKCVDYTKVIPFTVGAVQMLDEKVSSLENDIEKLKGELAKITTNAEVSIGSSDNYSSIQTGQLPNNSIVGKLGQNIPNPFSKTTIIPFTLENDMNDVAIMVTDLTGKTLINLPVVAIKGENKIEINSSQLYQGVFIYYLSVSGSIIDSKRMVVK